ncbi:MAG: feruloyl-CoA synthase [Burkholderiales bacterium]
MNEPQLSPADLFAKPAVVVDRREDGSMILRSPQALQNHARCVGEYLEHWANLTPQQKFLQERDAQGHWQGVTYGEAREQVRKIAAWLLRQNLSDDRPIAILSDNSVEHGLLTLAAMHIGVPVAPISQAYSLMSKDFAKLRSIFALLQPGLVYVADYARFSPALSAVKDLHTGTLVAGANAAGDVQTFSRLLSYIDDIAVERAFTAVNPDTIAKFLFTSGSTGEPKGVINTQRMLCASQQAKSQLWPFLRDTPPVIVDWLPWNHTFGANHNFNLVLRNGGTLYIDAGRPMPGLFEQTVKNLRDVSPTLYFNVPRGYDMLVTALRADQVLRHSFFKKLQVIFYAAAALPQNLWDALEHLSLETIGEKVAMVSAWGSTETAPLSTDCHFQAEKSGVIGLPVPGTALKLLRNGDKLEVRVRGANVTPGYWKRPDLTTKMFDEEGFYRIGDAVRFLDDTKPERGLVFDGRVAEDFKLSSGTWVNVGMLRVKALALLAPIAQDIVLTGHDHDTIGFLIFANIAAGRSLCADLPGEATPAQVLAHSAVRDKVSSGLQALQRDGGGTSTYATRALLMAEPASIDAGEITYKGYINQRAVLTHRAELVAILQADPATPEVIELKISSENLLQA